MTDARQADQQLDPDDLATALRVLEQLPRLDPDDPERPPIMTYRQAWEGHHSADLFGRYPLQLISPHPRFTFHTMSDGKDSTIQDVKDHRVLVVLRDVEDLSIEEICAITGLPDGTVKSRLHRARLALRKKVTRHL